LQYDVAQAEETPIKEEGEIPPSKFLFDNNDYFDLLFELLNHNNIDRDRVWDILTELPTNPVIEQTLRTLQSPDWSELINPHSLYKMLYCLQIIDQLMSSTEKDSVHATGQLFTAHPLNEANSFLRRFKFKPRTNGASSSSTAVDSVTFLSWSCEKISWTGTGTVAHLRVACSCS